MNVIQLITSAILGNTAIMVSFIIAYNVTSSEFTPLLLIAHIVSHICLVFYFNSESIIDYLKEKELQKFSKVSKN